MPLAKTLATTPSDPRDAPVLLAFDSATERLAVALQAGGRRWVDNRAGGAAASAELLPAVMSLLQQAALTTRDVDAVAFGQGPGAFTGLRTSCAAAQGLALGLDCPVLPLDSLLLVAEQARRAAGLAGQPFDIGVAMDARMGEIYAAHYVHDGRRWQVRSAPGLWAPADLAQAWAAQPPAHAAGSALPFFTETLSAACPRTQAVDVDDDRASALAELASQAWRAGAGCDAADALPVYLRDKVAQTTAEREAARALAR